jgi:hypothetical protein
MNSSLALFRSHRHLTPSACEPQAPGAQIAPPESETQDMNRQQIMQLKGRMNPDTTLAV